MKKWIFALLLTGLLITSVLLGYSARNTTGETACSTTEVTTEPILPKADTWQSAYLHIIWNLPDYLADVFMAENDRESPELYDSVNNSVYLGIHDFDSDGIPELIAGDTLALAVFTFADGHAEKLADLYYPDAIWCINGVYFKEHSVSTVCAGSDGCDFAQFGYIGGEYRLGLYSERHDPFDIFINGEVSTLEEMNRIYPTDFDQRADSEWRNRMRLMYENGGWVLKSYDSEEGIILDSSFDFNLINWD